MKLHITDHALLRYIERVHGVPLEPLRRELQRKASRAAAAAQSIGGGRFVIVFDGMKFRCADDKVVTIVTGDPERDHVG